MDNKAPELAEKQSAKINKHGGKRANSGGRRFLAGRKKGSPNKLTADVKAAIMAAFDEVGGADYLKSVATTDPRTGARRGGVSSGASCAGTGKSPSCPRQSCPGPCREGRRP